MGCFCFNGALIDHDGFCRKSRASQNPNSRASGCLIAWVPIYCVITWDLIFIYLSLYSFNYSTAGFESNEPWLGFHGSNLHDWVEKTDNLVAIVTSQKTDLIFQRKIQMKRSQERLNCLLAPGMYWTLLCASFTGHLNRNRIQSQSQSQACATQLTEGPHSLRLARLLLADYLMSR